MTEPMLVARLAGRRVAFPARLIASIIEVDRITPVPMSPDHIEGLSTLRSKALTLVNCSRVLGKQTTSPEDDAVRQAAVVKHNGHHYALLLDGVEDVVDSQTEPEEILGGVGDEWANVAVGKIETETGPALLLEIEPFINVPQVEAA